MKTYLDLKRQNKVIFTSVAPNYFDKACALYQSVQETNPEYDFFVICCDFKKNVSPINIDGFNIVYIDDLFYPEWFDWFHIHDIVELSTAVKPFLARKLQNIYEEIIYLDPDTYLFNKLTTVSEALCIHSLALAPHMLNKSNGQKAIKDNEISALKHGVFNLGFLGLNSSSKSKQVSEFWMERCFFFCCTDLSSGAFTDQKFFDLAPIFFDDTYILRDYGYDVASWNLSERRIEFDNQGNLLSNGVPLVFYHFTSYDSGKGYQMSKIYGRESPAVAELWAFYTKQCNNYKKYLNLDNTLNKWSFEKAKDNRSTLRNRFFESVSFNFSEIL
jgi:hypothetical protein